MRKYNIFLFNIEIQYSR